MLSAINRRASSLPPFVSVKKEEEEKEKEKVDHLSKKKRMKKTAIKKSITTYKFSSK
jgi:hypothetical protein